MKKLNLIISSLLIVFTLNTFAQDKLISSKTHIKFFSHTIAEDIQANNYSSVCIIIPSTGSVVFSVPMQSFEFEKALMQKHFNSTKFLNTKANPKAKLKAKITNLSEINFTKDGVYEALVEGEMTINGITNPIKEKAKITVKNGSIKVNSTFTLTLADYKVAFEKGKPSTNIAKEVEVTVYAEF